MSKATSAANVIKWLANQGDDVVASADDLSEFGPNAARVRALLDFIPTMSDDAVRASNAAHSAASSYEYDAAIDGAHSNAYDNAGDAAYDAAPAGAGDAVYHATYGPRYAGATGDATAGAYNAALGDIAGDLISPENYRILTNPLAAGRAVDLLRARPRNQGTQFLDVVRSMGERGALTGPRDVVVASRLAKSPEDIREIALTLMLDGMSAEEAMRAARLL